jgi:GNAT superfamily N-acetyltransferase
VAWRSPFERCIVQRISTESTDLTTSEPEATLATTSDVGRLSAVLASAFAADPVFGWLVPDARRRPARLRRFFALELRHVALAHGAVSTDPDRSGAALWMPPGAWRVPTSVLVGHGAGFARAFGARLPLATGLLARVERRHLRDPHYYLAYMGVAPAAQGRGLGTRLMRPTLERCDAAALPAYLEATSERNRSLYQRVGFEVVDEIRFAGSPPLWPMLRAPGGRGRAYGDPPSASGAAS